MREREHRPLAQLVYTALQKNKPTLYITPTHSAHTSCTIDIISDV